MSYREIGFQYLYLDPLDALPEEKRTCFLEDLGAILGCDVKITNTFGFSATLEGGVGSPALISVSSGAVQFLYFWSLLTLAFHQDPPPTQQICDCSELLLDFFSVKNYAPYDTPVSGVSFGTECFIDVSAQLSLAINSVSKNLALRCTLGAIAFMVAHEVAHAVIARNEAGPRAPLRDVMDNYARDWGEAIPACSASWMTELQCDELASILLERTKPHLVRMSSWYSLAWKTMPTVHMGGPLFAAGLHAIETFKWFKYSRASFNDSHPPAELRYRLMQNRKLPPELEAVRATWWAKTHVVLALMLDRIYRPGTFGSHFVHAPPGTVSSGLPRPLEGAALETLQKRVDGAWKEHLETELP